MPTLSWQDVLTRLGCAWWTIRRGGWRGRGRAGWRARRSRLEGTRSEVLGRKGMG